MTDRELLDEAYVIALQAIAAYEALLVCSAADGCIPGLERCKKRAESFVAAYQMGGDKKILRFAHTYTPHSPQEELE